MKTNVSYSSHYWDDYMDDVANDPVRLLNEQNGQDALRPYQQLENERLMEMQDDYERWGE